MVEIQFPLRMAKIQKDAHVWYGIDSWKKNLDSKTPCKLRNHWFILAYIEFS